MEDSKIADALILVIVSKPQTRENLCGRGRVLNALHFAFNNIFWNNLPQHFHLRSHLGSGGVEAVQQAVRYLKIGHKVIRKHSS